MARKFPPRDPVILPNQVSPMTNKRPPAKVRIAELEAENEQLKTAIVPMLALMADIREVINEGNPSLWVQRIEALEESLQSGDSSQYQQLVSKLLSGSFQVRGAFFEMFLPDGVKPPLPSDFDRSLQK